MPYNSQSPTILKLNQLFADYTKTPPGGGHLDAGNLDDPHTLTERAEFRGIVSTNAEKDHLNKWPSDQQALIVATLQTAITHQIPVSFAWEEAADFETVVVMFDNAIGITCRSIRNY